MMPKIVYVRKRFGESSRAIIDQANAIIFEYSRQGFNLTLRQLFYQFVSRDLIRNTMREYKRLGSIINDARMAGLIDWDAITDRTRNLSDQSHWRDPSHIIATCVDQFRLDKWAGQQYRPEVWIEKEALAGVFEGVCRELDIPYFCCRGYTSQSEMWEAGQRLRRHMRNEQTPMIFHFGDHDPSGIDMTRDIIDRLKIFMGGVELERLALNMDQVEEYSPPPNPAKTTDSRYAGYIAQFGDESWELDALDPATLAGLVRTAVEGIRDAHLWAQAVEEESEHRRLLAEVSRQWDDLAGEL